MKRISTLTNFISMLVVAGVLLGIGQGPTLASTHLHAGFEDSFRHQGLLEGDRFLLGEHAKLDPVHNGERLDDHAGLALNSANPVIHLDGTALAHGEELLVHDVSIALGNGKMHDVNRVIHYVLPEAGSRAVHGELLRVVSRSDHDPDREHDLMNSLHINVGTPADLIRNEHLGRNLAVDHGLTVSRLKPELNGNGFDASLPNPGSVFSGGLMSRDLSPNRAGERGLKRLDIRKEIIGTVEWQWANNPVSILRAMKVWFTDRDAALAELQKGQAKNPRGQKIYEMGVSKVSDFWDLVFKHSSWTADFATLEKSLKWEYQNEWTWLNDSRNSWRSKPRKEMQAYFYLLWGQRKNWKALANYRACWNDDNRRVMKLVDRFWQN